MSAAKSGSAVTNYDVDDEGGLESLSISVRKRQFLLFSPLLIILVGFTTATLFSRFIQEWAWVPLALVYWTAMGVFVFIGKGDKRLKDWIRKPKAFYADHPRFDTWNDSIDSALYKSSSYLIRSD